jgi:hypothetical protein
MTKPTCRRLIPLGLALVSFLAVAGCGDDADSDEAAVKEVITGFFTDVAENNGTEACERLTTGTVRIFSVVAPAAGAPATCSDHIRVVNGQMTEEEKDALKTAEVKSVTVSGDAATVAPDDVVFELRGTSTLLSSVKAGPVLLKNVDDEWKIESLG